MSKRIAFKSLVPAIVLMGTVGLAIIAASHLPYGSARAYAAELQPEIASSAAADSSAPKQAAELPALMEEIFAGTQQMSSLAARLGRQTQQALPLPGQCPSRLAGGADFLRLSGNGLVGGK